MIYTQFYSKSAISNDLIESCGDRSVIILDGREKASSHHAISKSECIKRKYLAYALFRGDSFSRSTKLSDIIYV